MNNRYAIDKTIAIADLRFHYRDWDGRGHPVILIHGLSSTSHIWDLAAPLIADEARVIALDLRGHGQSDKPEEGYDFATITGDVLGVMGLLQLTRPVLVGHSWGAHVALWASAHHPDRIAGLILVDGGVTELSHWSWEETLRHLTPPPVDGMLVDEFREQVLEGAPQGLLTPAVEAAMMANFEIDADNRIRRRLPHAQHLLILRELWELRVGPLLEKVDCPALLIPCRQQGHDDPVQVERKMKAVEAAEENLEDITVIWLEDTIHDAPLQRPHQIAAEITTFVHERL
nr:alpha/beta hydrolase [Anaerolineae bacterium]